MLINTYGNEELPKILALHPMLANGQDMALLAGKLRRHCCVISPDLSGQGKDKGDFESAEKEAETLYTCLKERGWLDISLIYGGSLGAVVGLELLAKPGLKTHMAVFDGCPLYRDASVLRWILTKVFLTMRRKAVSDPEFSVREMTKMYGPLLGPGMGKGLAAISENSLRAIVDACSRCSFPHYPKEVEQKLHFEYGSRDFNLKICKKNIAKYYPNASLTVRKGYGHCQYMSSLGERYGEALKTEYHYLDF